MQPLRWATKFKWPETQITTWQLKLPANLIGNIWLGWQLRPCQKKINASDSLVYQLPITLRYLVSRTSHSDQKYLCDKIMTRSPKLVLKVSCMKKCRHQGLYTYFFFAILFVELYFCVCKLVICLKKYIFFYVESKLKIQGKSHFYSLFFNRCPLSNTFLKSYIFIDNLGFFWFQI